MESTILKGGRSLSITHRFPILFLLHETSRGFDTSGLATSTSSVGYHVSSSDGSGDTRYRILRDGSRGDSREDTDDREHVRCARWIQSLVRPSPCCMSFQPLTAPFSATTVNGQLPGPLISGTAPQTHFKVLL